MQFFVPTSFYFASAFSWEENFNCVPEKSDKIEICQGKIAHAGDSIWPPESKTQAGKLQNDQASITRAEGTSATTGSAYPGGGGSKEQGGELLVRTMHRETWLEPLAIMRSNP